MTENTINKKGLLQKRIKDLSEEELDSLRIVFGTPELPFPTLVSKKVQTQDGWDVEYEIGAYGSVEDDDEAHRQPLAFYSEKEPAEVLGTFYREMPTPSMLEYMITVMQRMAPESKNRHFALFGDPGEGKSFMGEMFARAQSERPALSVNCGGKNLNELQFEVVLDRKDGESVFDAIDQKLEKGALSGYSQGALLDFVNELIEARHNKNGDAESEISTQLQKKEVADYLEMDASGQEIVSVNWDSVSKDAARDAADKFKDVMRDIAKAERFDAGGSSAFGMHTEYGKNIQAEREGRMLIKDEYNKSKAGGDDALQTNLQYETGEVDSCVLNNPMKDSSQSGDDYTIKREDQKLGTFYWYTGNKKIDGITTRELSKSVQDRLDIKEITAPKEMDFAHRLCQIVTGLPVTTLYDLYSKAQGENFDKKAFGDMLITLREAGLSQEEKDAIPELQRTLLSNWEKTMEGLKQVSGLVYDFAHKLDPSKMADHDSDGFEDLLDEVTQEVFDMSAFSFRQLGKLSKEANADRPEPMQAEELKNIKVIDFNALSQKRSVSKKEQDDPALNFGTRWVKTLMRKIEETSIQADRRAMYAEMMKMAEKRGVAEKSLVEAGRGNLQLVEDLLNQTMYDNEDKAYQAQLSQSIMCSYLRENYEDMVAPANDNEDVMPVSKIMMSLDREENDGGFTEGHENMLAPQNNPEYMDVSSFRPVVKVDSIDFSLIGDGDDDYADFQNELIEGEFKKLLSLETFLTSLALPKVGDENINALFAGGHHSLLYKKDHEGAAIPAAGGFDMDTGETVGNSAGVSHSMDSASLKPKTSKDSVALQMAQNDHESGVAVTTVALGNYAEDGSVKNTKVHVLNNAKLGKTVLIGGELSPRLRTYFKHKGIVHIAQNDPNLKSKVETQVNILTRQLNEKERIALKDAFLSRMAVDENVNSENSRLVDLLTDKKLAPYNAVWLLNESSQTVNNMKVKYAEKQGMRQV